MMAAAAATAATAGNNVSPTTAGDAGGKCCPNKVCPTGAGAGAGAGATHQPTRQQQQAPTTTTTSLGQDSLIHAVAGGFGSALALAVTYPLDQVRTFQQVHDNEEDDAYIQHGGRSPLLTGATCDAAASGSGAAWWAAHVAPLLRPWRSATLLVQRHGPGALYRGIVPVLVSMGVSNAVFFFVSNLLKAVLTRYRQKTGRSLGYFGHLATSTVAGVLNVLLTTPLWVASMRAKLESGHGWDIVAIMLRIYKEEGLKALWSGTLPSLLLVINPVLQHFCYDQFKRATLTPRRASAATAAGAAAVTLTSLEAFSFGAVAKAIATVVSYPLQVAQSRLRQQQQQQQQQQEQQQQQQQEPSPPSSSSKAGGQQDQGKEGEGEAADRIGSKVSYTGTADCLADLWRRKGMAGLFQGIEAKLLQTVLTSAFMFASYESIYRATKRAVELSASGGGGGGVGGAGPKLLA